MQNCLEKKQRSKPTKVNTSMNGKTAACKKNKKNKICEQYNKDKNSKGIIEIRNVKFDEIKLNEYLSNHKDAKGKFKLIDINNDNDNDNDTNNDNNIDYELLFTDWSVNILNVFSKFINKNLTKKDFMFNKTVAHDLLVECREFSDYLNINFYSDITHIIFDILMDKKDESNEDDVCKLAIEHYNVPLVMWCPFDIEEVEMFERCYKNPQDCVNMSLERYSHIIYLLALSYLNGTGCEPNTFEGYRLLLENWIERSHAPSFHLISRDIFCINDIINMSEFHMFIYLWTQHRYLPSYVLLQYINAEVKDLPKPNESELKILDRISITYPDIIRLDNEKRVFYNHMDLMLTKYCWKKTTFSYCSRPEFKMLRYFNEDREKVIQARLSDHIEQKNKDNTVTKENLKLKWLEVSMKIADMIHK